MCASEKVSGTGGHPGVCSGGSLSIGPLLTHERKTESNNQLLSAGQCAKSTCLSGMLHMALHSQ